MKNFTTADNDESLDDEARALIGAAKAAAEYAYAPYSQFRVGAAVLLEDGSTVAGSNQENAAYPSGMCAERVALYAAASRYPGRTITKLTVVARSETGTGLVPATPCGSCRQAILEFETRQAKPIQIIMKTGQAQWVTAHSAGSLLPYSFTKGMLNQPEPDR